MNGSATTLFDVVRLDGLELTATKRVLLLQVNGPGDKVDVPIRQGTQDFLWDGQGQWRSEVRCGCDRPKNICGRDSVFATSRGASTCRADNLLLKIIKVRSVRVFGPANSAARSIAPVAPVPTVFLRFVLTGEDNRIHGTIRTAATSNFEQKCDGVRQKIQTKRLTTRNGWWRGHRPSRRRQNREEKMKHGESFIFFAKNRQR